MEYKLDKLFENVLNESYEQEHEDAVMLAKENYNSWLNLIIWDLLEIQKAYKKLTEATTLQKYEHCLKVLDEDIKILNSHTKGTSTKIFYVQESNRNLIKLVGYINETISLLDNEQQKKELLVLIQKMKDAVHNFVIETHRGLNGFIWAENIWNKLPLEKKNEILHDIDVKAENEEPNPDGDFIKI